MKVLLLASQFPPAYLGGGPIRTLAALVDQAPPGAELSILTRDRDLGTPGKLPVERNAWVSGPNSSRVRYATVGRLDAYISALWSTRKSQDVIYVNSFFDLAFGIVVALLYRVGFWRDATLVIAARGQFSQGALALKSHKKRAYIALFRRLFPRGVLWHASSPKEAQDIAETFGPSVKIIEREDETELPLSSIDPTTHLDAENELLKAVFISRISPMKGLPVLLEALQRVEGPISLDVYGPEEDPIETSTAIALANELAGRVECRLMGSIPPEMVRETFARYDVFLFPTAGENFGHVIAEALSAACPVMVTDSTPWSATIRAGGGVVVGSRKASDWADAITSYVSQGRPVWNQARQSAGAAYERWAATPKGPHILELVQRIAG